MHTKKLFISIPIALLIFLAGCQAEQPLTTSEQVKPSENSLSATNQTVSSSGQYSAVDQAAYDGAQQLKDLSFCDKINDENYKKACKDVISDLTALEEATTKIDTSLCAKLSTTDQQKACNIRVEILQTQNKKLADQQKTMDEASKSGDYRQCQKLTDKNQISVCEYNLLTNQAIKAKDPGVCDKASDRSVKDSCRKRAQKS